MNGLKENGIVGVDDLFKLEREELEFDRENDIVRGSKENNPDEGSVVNPEDNPGNGGSRKSDDEGGTGDVVINPENKDDIDSGSDGNRSDDIKNIAYHRIINELCKRNVLSDLRDIRFQAEDGSEVGFDDIDMSDDDSFVDMLSTIITNQRESMLQDKIDVGSISEFTKKLIQADKAGANVLDILKQYDRINAPLENLNPEDKQDQLKIIRHYVNMLGLPKDEADEFYNGIVSKGDDYIEAKAVKYKSELDKKMNDFIEERTKAAEEKKKRDADDFKQYKKALKTAIQNQYQLSENMVAKAMDFVLGASKSNPSITKLNDKVRIMLTTPDLAPDLIMFLMDPDEFVRQKSNKKVSDEKKKIYRMISSTKRDRSKAPVDDQGNEIRGTAFEEIALKE